MNLRRNILISLAAFILTIIAYLYIDAPLGLWIDSHVRSQKLLQEYTSNIPDLLLLSVILLSGLSWAGYFYLKSRGIQNSHRVFFLITGLVLPISFVVKTLLKLMFGRVETRLWLQGEIPDGMHWFAGGNGFDGFPSGHMLVFATLFIGLWQFYPRYLVLWLITWLGLSVALMLTNYHFLSDVIAGSYFGALVYCCVSFAVIRRRMHNH